MNTIVPMMAGNIDILTIYNLVFYYRHPPD
jgi:hypothetical protein